MNTTNPKVDWYFNKAEKWQDEIKKLRVIVLDCPLIEELKWGVPCYTFQSSNIVLIHTFKNIVQSCLSKALYYRISMVF